MKKSWFLYLAILIPLLMILITGLGISYYRVEMNPKENFLYYLSKDPDQFCLDRIKTQFIPNYQSNSFLNRTTPCSPIDLYLYDFSKNTNTKISFEQAKKLTFLSALNSNHFWIEQCYTTNPNFIIFDLATENRGYYFVCLTKNNYRKKLNIQIPYGGAGGYFYFQFVGWVKAQSQ